MKYSLKITKPLTLEQITHILRAMGCEITQWGKDEFVKSGLFKEEDFEPLRVPNCFNQIADTDNSTTH